MRYTSVASSILLALSLLAGCAAPYAQGLTALRQGRFEEAADHFQEVLAQDPNRLDALAGLGISRYKLGELDEAVDALDRVVAQSPTWPEARLYLGLSYLQRGQGGLAEEQLTMLLDQKPHPRTAAQIDRALRVMRLEPPSDELRGFLAASLDDEAAWEGEVRHARLALRDCAWQLARAADPVPVFEAAAALTVG
jgi:Flp pilus assembly protein TadD